MFCPNMTPEIIEAIEQYYRTEPVVAVDCYLHLIGMDKNPNLIKSLKNASSDKLEDMGRCPKCGALMLYDSYKEPHSELDDCLMETMVEKYCPNCDRKLEDYI